MKLLWIGLVFLLSATVFAEDTRLARIAKEFDAREEHDGSTGAHIKWLKTDAGKQDVAYLAEHFSELNDTQRSTFPMELARTGAVAVVPLLEKSLAISPDSLAGIYYACKLGQLEPGFGQKVAPLVLQWVGKTENVSGDTAMEMLPLLDPELASKVLLSGEFLSREKFPLVLESFNRAAVKVPRTILDPFLKDCEGPAMKGDARWQVVRGYQEGLKALALHDDQRTVAAAERAVATHPEWADDLADIHLIASGLGLSLGDKLEDIADDPARFSKLPAAAQYYFSVTYFRDDCENGGLSQALSNSTGDYLPLVRKAYEVIGAKREIQWLDFMLKPFGKAGPSANRAKRQRQMDSMQPSYFEQEDGLQERWEKAHGKDPAGLSVSWLLAVYVSKHAAEIRKALR